jgi:hypothetical protein
MSIGAGTYTENLSWYLRSRGYPITIAGTLSTVASLTATGGFTGTAATANSAYVTGDFTGHTDSDGANSYTGKLLFFTSGLNVGTHPIIGQTTATRIYLVGDVFSNTPQNGDTFDIKGWGTVIKGAITLVSGTGSGDSGGNPLVINFVRFLWDTPSSWHIYLKDSRVIFQCSSLENTTTGQMINADNWGCMAATWCNISDTSGVGTYVGGATWYGFIAIASSLVQSTGKTVFFAAQMGTVTFQGSFMKSGDIGLKSMVGGLLDFFSGGSTNNHISGCTTSGIVDNAQVHELTNVVYGLNLDGTTVLANGKNISGSNYTLAKMTNATTVQPVMDTAVSVLVTLETATFDLGSNLVIGDLYGASGAYRQADADSDSTHIQDDDAVFSNTILGVGLGNYVKWSSAANGVANAGEGYATYDDADTLHIYKSSGADFAASYYYWIRKSYYVAPISGYYDLKVSGVISACEDGKRYNCGYTVNGVNTTLFNAHASYAASTVRSAVGDLIHLAAGDKISMFVGNTNATAATCYPNVAGNGFLAIYCIEPDLD